MKLIVESKEIIGSECMNSFLKALSGVMNQHVIGSGSKIKLSVPDGKYDDNGVYSMTMTVEFEEKPHESFKDRNK